jgi:hypothetical protein
MKNKSKLMVLSAVTVLCLCGYSLLAQDDNGGGPGGPPPGQPGDGGGPGGDGGFGGDRGPGGPGGNFDPAQFEQRLMEMTRKSLNLTNDEEWAAIQPLIQKVMDARRAVGFGGMGPGGRGRPGSQASREQQALQKAIDDGAPVAQIKETLAKFRAARKDKQAALAAAQANLESVLNSKQEAQAVLLGLLP